MNDSLSAFDANEYDDQIKRTVPFYEEFYKQVVELVNIQFHTSIQWLDVGSGTGKMAEVAFENLSFVDRFVLCDHCQEMIEIAKERLQGNPKTEFVHQSLFDVDVHEIFHVITAMQVLHYYQQKERISAIQKCYQALRENGMFITFENFAPNSEMGLNLFLTRWKSYQCLQGKAEQECDRHIARYGKDYFPIPVAEHLAILRSCGFRACEVIWLSNMQVGLMGIK